MWLDCGEHGIIPLKRITPNSVVLSQSFSAPPCFAKLVVSVDGKIMSQRVSLPSGISESRLAVMVRSIDEGVAPF